MYKLYDPPEFEAAKAVDRELYEAAEVDAIAARVVDAVAAPFELSGGSVTVTASVGIAFSGRGDQLSEQLLQDAKDDAVGDVRRLECLPDAPMRSVRAASTA